jgi:Uncharacterized conserved protein (COG2071)
MRLPVIQGVIRRRILVNFRVDPGVMQAQLPARFTPKLQGSHAIAGVCLIRLEGIRPRFAPAPLGLSSENAAHRIAVRWESDRGEPKEGVFIPRRDTGSVATRLMGGRLFPGEHHRAAFTVQEDAESIDLRMQSLDGSVEVHVRGRFGGPLPGTSCFPSLAAASGFFEPGSLGYSATSQSGRLDGLELRTREWRIEPLQVEEVRSSYFADTARFPPGSVEFDCALAMRNLAHEWRSADDLYV